MKRDRPTLVAAEMGLASLTLVTVLGMGRLFAGGDWMAPLLLHAVAAHVVVALARRRGLPLATTGALLVPAASLLGAWTSYGPTTAFGIPTGDTISTMRVDLSQAWTLYQDVVAPAPVETGFVIASAFAIWVVAFVADWAAFRLWVPFEATLPAGTLFLFTALLGADAGRTWAVGLFAAACLALFLLHRMARQDGSSHWVADRGPQGHRWLLGAGMVLGGSAVLIGSVVGPLVPGADAVGVINPRGLRDTQGSRITISPLVDIRSRLVDQSNQVAFDVQSPEPAYWRLTSLDRFDGRIWSSSGSFSEARGKLPEAVPTDLPASTVEQTFRIGALAAIWLPSAYEPRAVDAPDFGVLYDKTSATLIVDREITVSDGLSYDVTSSSPRISPDDLAGAAGEIPEQIRERFLQLPGGFSPDVAQLAQEITAGAATPYAQALALQAHLRTFTYDLNVSAGHSDQVLEQFLFQTKRGYCEQFAGSFAAMARSIGLPARVAVGFTQGEQDPDDPTHFIVRGEHAHAWPEVFLAGAGWVSFEPTPGRGQPFTEGYTGVPASQAATANPGTATTTPPTTASDPGATIPDASSDPRSVRDEVATGGGDSPSSSSKDRTGLWRLISDPARRIAPIAAAAVLVYLALFPLALLTRRFLRRRRATSVPARISLAWIEAIEAAQLVGYQEVRSHTYVERAERLAAALPDGDCPEHARLLATCIEVASYSAAGADDRVARHAETASAAISAGARAAATTRARVRRWIDPRPWVRISVTRLRRPSQITATIGTDREADRALAGSSSER